MKSLAARSLLKSRFSFTPLSAATSVRLLVFLGIALRFIHFLKLPSVWHDEAAVMLNAMHLGFGQMLGPLSHHEAAPPLFLMAERVMFLLFGDSATAFRALPLAASCATLILFALVASRTLPRSAAVWAVALFATSDRLLWHAIEAKPYSCDVFVAVAIIFAFVAADRRPLWQRCLIALPLFLAALWLSFPACFVIGGWFARQWPAMRHSRSWARLARRGRAGSSGGRFVRGVDSRPGERPARRRDGFVLDRRLSQLAAALERAGLVRPLDIRHLLILPVAARLGIGRLHRSGRRCVLSEGRSPVARRAACAARPGAARFVLG